MAVDAQTLINILGGLVCSGMGWWLNNMWRAHETLRAQLGELAVDLPKNYVMKADMIDLRDAIFERFDRLERKLDNKADKA